MVDKKILILSVITVLIFVVLSPNVYATTLVKGKASSCSLLVTCSFTITSTAGSGWAKTSAFIGGYVGQSPLAFSGGSVNFQLPGEATATYASNVLNGQAILAGYSSTAGTLYNSTGKFVAKDSNTGKIVSGMVNTFVGIKGHSGRGGGNIYTLVNGTIIIIQTNLDATSTSVTCNPSSIGFGSSSTCTVTVTDVNTISGSIPTGVVTFANSSTSLGSLSKGGCILSSGGCSVTFYSNLEFTGSDTITAYYRGDSSHYTSSASTAISVTGGGN